MARTPHDVTDAELAILQLLWENREATIRYLTDSLYPHGGTAQYATVQKLLERLETKGFVRRDRAGAAPQLHGDGWPRRPDRPPASGRGRETVRRIADAAADAPRPDQTAQRAGTSRIACPHRRVGTPRQEQGRVTLNKESAMENVLHLGLSNAVASVGLALVAAAAAFLIRRRPALIHALWLLVLLKLFTPALVRLPAPWPVEGPSNSAEGAAGSERARGQRR